MGWGLRLGKIGINFSVGKTKKNRKRKTKINQIKKNGMKTKYEGMKLGMPFVGDSEYKMSCDIFVLFVSFCFVWN